MNETDKFLIVGDYLFNLSKIRNAYGDRNGNLNIHYTDGKEYSYSLKYSEFVKELQNASLSY